MLLDALLNVLLYVPLNVLCVPLDIFDDLKALLTALNAANVQLIRHTHRYILFIKQPPGPPYLVFHSLLTGLNDSAYTTHHQD